MKSEFKDEQEMRERLSSLGFPADKIEKAIEVWRNRPHPSKRARAPHPLKGKKHPRMQTK